MDYCPIHNKEADAQCAMCVVSVITPRRLAAGDGSLDPLVLRIRQARGRRDSCWNRLCKAQDAYRQSEAHLHELASELVQCVEGNAQNDGDQAAAPGSGARPKPKRKLDMPDIKTNPQGAVEPASTGSARREITPEDVTAEGNRNYDLGRKHGKAELMDDIERARDIALRLVPDEGKPEIEEAFQRLSGVSAPNVPGKLLGDGSRG